MFSFRTTTTILGALLLSHLQPCLALPRGWVDWSDSAVTPNYDHASNLFKRTNPGDFYLRIMPLGASITVGEPAPDDDEWKTGYRYWLRKKLRADEWDVNMVGNYQSGEMKDNVSGSSQAPGYDFGVSYNDVGSRGSIWRPSQCGR